ncbi:MAG: hypothetical protein ABI614_24495 [Planctomycetota bacterium]
MRPNCQAWIPPELRLPDTVEAIEADRTPKPPAKQRDLFADKPAVLRVTRGTARKPPGQKPYRGLSVPVVVTPYSTGKEQLAILSAFD